MLSKKDQKDDVEALNEGYEGGALMSDADRARHEARD